MLITEKILGDIGGWQAMKAARQLVTDHAVEQTEREGDSFRGLVREGKRKFATTLAVQGPTKADCRCSCSEAQRGLVCAHAIAIALATLQPAATSPAHPIAPGKASAVPAPNKPPPHGKFDVFIPAQRIEVIAGGRGELPVFLQFQSGGEEADPVARWLMEQQLSAKSGPLSLDVATLDGFFNALRGHPRVWDGRPGTAVEQRRRITVVGDGERMIELRARLETDGKVAIELVAQQGAGLAKSQGEIKSGTWQVPLLDSLMLGARTWIWQRDALVLSPLPVTHAEVGELIYECLDKKSGGARRDLRWLARNLDAIENVLRLETDEALSHLRLLPAEPRFVIEFDGSPRQVTSRVEVVVGMVRHPVSSQDREIAGDLYPIPADDGSLTFFQRNIGRERRVRSELESAGFIAAADGGWVLRGEREVAAFFAGTLPGLQRRHEINFSERWQAAFRGWRRIAPLVRTAMTDHSVPASGAGWLEMDFAYEAADGFRVPRHELLRLLRGGQSTVRGPQGRTYVLDAESCDDFESLLSESGARLGEGGRVALSGENGHVLNEFLAAGQAVSKLVLPELAEVQNRLGDLAGKLRNYQLEGVRWLIASAEAGRGALLADDMGLGKTLQVIALLRWLATCEQPANCEQLPRKSALVVCPTSLIHNWLVELQRFAPELNVEILHGADRVIHKSINRPFCVLLTSYVLLSRDLELHKQGCYQAVVLDEASYIRNPDTQVARLPAAWVRRCGWR